MIISSESYSLNAQNELVIDKNVTVSGTWSLTDNHDLCLTVDSTQNTSYGDKIILNSTISDVGKNSVTFKVTHLSDTQQIVTDTLCLQGAWKADANNKLLFEISSEQGRHDILSFNSTWIINGDNRLVYSYERADLIYKHKETAELVFKGTWDIVSDNRLYYELDHDSSSGFGFTVGDSILQKNQIVAKLMIGTEARDIKISGEWHVTDSLGLTFDVHYEAGQISHIIFGGQLQLSPSDSLALRFDDGVEVKLSQAILDGKADVFSALKLAEDEDKITLGFELKF